MMTNAFACLSRSVTIASVCKGVPSAEGIGEDGRRQPEGDGHPIAVMLLARLLCCIQDVKDGQCLAPFHAKRACSQVVPCSHDLRIALYKIPLEGLCDKELTETINEAQVMSRIRYASLRARVGALSSTPQPRPPLTRTLTRSSVSPPIFLASISIRGKPPERNCVLQLIC